MLASVHLIVSCQLHEHFTSQSKNNFGLGLWFQDAVVIVLKKEKNLFHIKWNVRKEFKIRLWVRHTGCCAFLIVTPWMISEVTASQTLLLWIKIHLSCKMPPTCLSYIDLLCFLQEDHGIAFLSFFFFFFKVTWFMGLILQILNCGLGSALPQHLLSCFFLLLGTLQSYQSHPGIQHTSWVCS